MISIAIEPQEAVLGASHRSLAKGFVSLALTLGESGGQLGENQGGKPGETHGKTMEIPGENHGNTMEKPWVMDVYR